MLPSPSTSIPRQLLLAVLAVAALLASATLADNNDGDARAGEASGTAVVGCGAFLEAAEACSEEAAQGHTQRAREMATQLVGVVPGCAKAWACYGAVAYQLQNLQEAKTGFEQAVALAPSPDSFYHSNLGVVQYNLGLMTAAVHSFQAALEIDASLHMATLMLGAALYDLGEYRAGVEHYRRALSATSWDVRRATLIRCQLSFGLSSLGLVQQAAAVLAEGLAVDPVLHIRHALAFIPVVQLSHAESASLRQQTEAHVDAVLARLRDGTLSITRPGAAPPSPLDVAGDMGYYLTYQGRNDRQLRTKIADMYSLAFPSALGYSIPGANLQNNPIHGGVFHSLPPLLTRHIRVGFVSDYLYQHSVGKMCAKLIAALPRHLFHVTVFRFFGPSDWVSRFIDHAADEVETLPESQTAASLQQAQQALAAANLDVLVFPELGMHLQTFLLAFGRYAPVQITSHGNSVTSGLKDSIDYFVSLDAAEPPQAEQHYAEQLVRVEGHHSGFLAPRALPQHGPSSKATFGAQAMVDGFGVSSVLVGDESNTDVHVQLPIACNGVGAVYVMPQVMYKLGPDCDALIVGLLQRDPCGHVFLVQGQNTAWDALVRDRLRRHAHAGVAREEVDTLLSRIIVMPRLKHRRFLTMLSTADVVVDSFPFGGCTTTYEALAMGTPVVSMPSDALRGRFTMALLQAAGMESLLAESVEQLIGHAINVGNGTAWASPEARQAQQTSIADAAAHMMESQAANQDWSRLLVRAVALAFAPP